MKASSMKKVNSSSLNENSGEKCEEKIWKWEDKRCLARENLAANQLCTSYVNGSRRNEVSVNQLYIMKWKYNERKKYENVIKYSANNEIMKSNEMNGSNEMCEMAKKRKWNRKYQ